METIPPCGVLGAARLRVSFFQALYSPSVAEVAHPVEHQFPKLEVASSSLVFRSKMFRCHRPDLPPRVGPVLFGAGTAQKSWFGHIMANGKK